MKALSAEEVEKALAETIHPGAESYLARARLRDHIAALEAERLALLDLLRVNARTVPCPRCFGLDSRTCARCKGGSIAHHVPEVAAALAGAHPGAALLKRPEKALAQARNEGLRRAAVLVLARLHVDPAEGLASIRARIIALMEPVPCCERDTDGDGNCDRHPGVS